MHVDHPFGFDARGRTATADDDAHIRDMIEAVLFTSPGERVNRPTFGSGVLGLVFAPNGEALAAATRLSVEAALMEWLGDLIEVTGLEVSADDAALRLELTYTVRRTGEERRASLERGR